ncbi:SRPBCC domain-containing protein [Cyanobacteria bacterium FACHB-DQ100]|uniref:SRPBCC domain-containing protein n=1 Tax=unclassified Leptolyngbya TaxID=2650499 RepID=UPI001680C20D|nr:SRPBCC domain-containing protein [Leptolyngbya sp. FACHB-17]MBD1823698.1 SRPBCC domain-containing protein [Cyanobacteria bacterium FACHB-DQ100]MBD2079125.1 SRPBCC domain-containing protein [Leptolyngbya sp. FACHB-17]
MPSLYTEIDIRAARSQVWQILIAKERWKYWNTFLYDCDPSLPFIQGRDVALSLLRVPGEEEIQFRPIVTLVQPDYCLKWLSTIPGLRNEHVLELQDVGVNQTRFFYRQNFSGTLARFLMPFIRQDERQGIQRMAWELKQYAEHQSKSARFNR